MKRPLLLLFPVLLLFESCSTEPIQNVIENDAIPNGPESTDLYFPSPTSGEWETLSTVELEWNQDAEQPLWDFLDEKDTKAFIILKNGKMAVEWYFDDHTQNTSWYWASAGKTLTAFTVGLAQEEGILTISDKTSDYLGQG